MSNKVKRTVSNKLWNFFCLNRYGERLWMGSLWCAPHIHDEETGRSIGNLVVQNKQINTAIQQRRHQQPKIQWCWLPTSQVNNNIQKNIELKISKYDANFGRTPQELSMYTFFRVEFRFANGIAQNNSQSCYEVADAYWPFYVQIVRPKNAKNRQIWCFKHL